MMGWVFFGLIFFSLTACSGAFADETLAPEPGGSLLKPSPAGPRHPSKSSKRAARAQPDAHSTQRSLPLSSASAYASEHATGLPISSPLSPAAAPPPSHSWTGFYVGAGAGAAHP
jgi:hypothetical protein